MGRIPILLVVVVLFLAILLAWSVGSAEVANVNLQEEMRDLAAQGGAQIGLVEPSTDHDIRNAVAHKAQEHGIALKPKQVIVQRTVAGEKLKLHIAAQFHGAGELLAVLVESSFRLVERQKRELALPFFEWHLRARTLRPLVKTRGVRHDTAHG